MRRSSLRRLALLLPLVATGCGSDWKAATHPASGRLTINGMPAAGAVVQLVPTGARADARNSRPWGLVGADGRFELATYVGGKGAPAGDYAVTFTWPLDAASPTSADRLGGRFARVEASRWSVAIRPGANALEPIEVTDAPLTSAAAPARSRGRASRNAPKTGPFMPGAAPRGGS